MAVGCNLPFGTPDDEVEPATAVAPTPAKKPSAAQGEDAVPAGPLRDQHVFVELGVYLPRPSEGSLATAERLLKGALPDVKRVETPSAHTPVPWFFLHEMPASEYAPPDADGMRYSSVGVPESDFEKVAGAKQAIVVGALVAAENADAAQRKLLAFIAELALRVEGYPWDQETRQVYAREAWAERRSVWKEGIPKVSDHVTMHAYRDGELIRIITLGMSKFGYPDIVVNQVAGEDTRAMGNLINLVCQTLVERGQLDAISALDVSLDRIVNPSAKTSQNENIFDNAKRHAKLRLFYTAPEEGDPNNRLIELQFPTQQGESTQQAQGRVLREVYGSHDEMTGVEHDDPRLQAASKQAKQELDALHASFGERPSEAGEHLLVKAPFATPGGGSEWMWVEVTSWKGDVIKGLLSNDPFDVPDLKAGAVVTVKQASVFDYILRRADGTEAGDLTGPVIEEIAKGHRER